jgi:hypothetical protein
MVKNSRAFADCCTKGVWLQWDWGKHVGTSERLNVGTWGVRTHTLHSMDEYEKKGVGKWGPGKCMKRKNEDGNSQGGDEFWNGNRRTDVAPSPGMFL